MLGNQTRNGNMEGADESTELWRHPWTNLFIGMKILLMQKTVLAQSKLITSFAILILFPVLFQVWAWEEERKGGVAFWRNGKTENQKEEVDELEKSCWLFISCFFIFSPSPFRQTTTPPSLSLSLPHLSPWFAAMSWQRHNWESKLRHFQLIAFKILTFFFFIRKKLPRLLLCKETAANGEHFWIKIEIF